MFAAESGQTDTAQVLIEAGADVEATDKAFALIRKAVDADSLDGILRGGKVDPVFKRNIK